MAVFGSNKNRLHDELLQVALPSYQIFLAYFHSPDGLDVLPAHPATLAIDLDLQPRFHGFS